MILHYNGRKPVRHEFNLPNALTATRIFLVPLLVVVLLTKFDGRVILGVREELIGASPLGKLKMIAQVVAILALILSQDEYLKPVGVLGYWALWVVVGTALLSGYDYYRRFTQMPPRVLTESPR